MKNKRTITKTGTMKPVKKATRSKILKAARKVFAQYAYHAASIRMVGKEAGIEHPLISYYFPSKAVLFEAILADIVEGWHKANQDWFEGLEKMSPGAGFALYLDRMIAYCREHPYAVRVFLLNVVQAQDSETIPGYRVIQTFFEQMTELMKDRIPMQASDQEIEVFIQSFNTLNLSYLGAKSYYAAILGMDPDSIKYEKWVKEMLVELFLPRLKHLLAGNS
jgi:AcrR family transcriptional regulator